jgi:hypothetical protein
VSDSKLLLPTIFAFDIFRLFSILFFSRFLFYVSLFYFMLLRDNNHMFVWLGFNVAFRTIWTISRREWSRQGTSSSGAADVQTHVLGNTQ